MPRERAAVAFFGIRGIGSIYYLAFGVNHLGNGPYSARLWAIGGLVITVSIVVHGVLAKPVMRYVDARRRAPDPPG